MKQPTKADRLSDIAELKEPEIFETELHGMNVGGYLRQGSSDIVFLGGRPGNGKTMLALQLAYAISQYSSVLFFSLEMTKEQLRSRLSRDRQFNPDCELYIYSQPSITIEKLIEVSSDHHSRNPLGLIVVDYTQIVQTIGRTKAEEVGEVVTGLKTLALELGIPILSLAQLNRNIEARQVGVEFCEPQMSDLADSASIEKWADCCLILHRVPKSDGIIKVVCVKNRHGSKTAFNLKLNRGNLRFEDSEGE